MTGETLRFDGCRTRAEAEARLRDWLQRRADDAARKFQTDRLLDETLDVDSLNDALEFIEDLTPQQIDDAVAQFFQLLDNELPFLVAEDQSRPQS